MLGGIWSDAIICASHRSRWATRTVEPKYICMHACMGIIFGFVCEPISFVLATAMHLAPVRPQSDDDAGQGCPQEEGSSLAGPIA